MSSGFARALWAAVLIVAAAPVSVFGAGPESVSELAATLSPAVVNISSRSFAPSGVPFPSAPEGSPLNELFDDLNPNEGLGPEALEEASSLGSGFIIRADGLIVTNSHVVEGADEILISLSDGTQLPAKIVGSDDKADLAVLKIDAGYDLPFVEFGNSDTALVGDWVMAVGNPFGLGGSVSIGIVSARNRDIQTGPYDDYIQTDAAINQGNSGGPLFDMNGKVVGIATAILAQTGNSVGIGFAVPANLAEPVIQQLAEFGETRRGWIGVGIQDVTPEIAASLGRPKLTGAMVVDVTKTGPSDGVIREGDIVLEFDGRVIKQLRDLSRFVAETAIGKAVKVKVLREGEERTLDVTLGRLETGEQLVAALEEPVQTPQPDDPDEPVGPPPGLKEMLGLDLGPIDAAVRKNFGLDDAASGLVVTEVVVGSDADRQGLVAGLVVTEVNQKKVSTVVDVTEKVNAAKEAGRPAVLFKVSEADGENRFVAVRLN